MVTSAKLSGAPSEYSIRQPTRGRRRAMVPLLANLLIILSVFAATACSKKNAGEKRYILEGEIVSIDSKGRKVNISHKEIPDYMPAMTMSFTMKEDWAFQAAVRGAEVRATLVVSGYRSWLEDVVIVHSEPDQPAVGENASSILPKPGAPVPDFDLIDQDGRPIRFRQYRSKALILTFIYTRCPLSDYCPLMTRNFAEIERGLQAMPALHGRTRLLSITIDPEYDQAPVLRSYGLKQTARFDHWSFAGGSARQVRAVAEYFGLRYWPEKEQIIHSLNTAIVGPDGRLFRLYSGNEWKPAELLSDLESLRM